MQMTGWIQYRGKIVIIKVNELTFITQKNKLSKFGLAARNHALNYFDWDLVSKKIIYDCEELVKYKNKPLPFKTQLIHKKLQKKLFIFIHSLKARGSLLLGALAYTFIFAYLAQLAGLAPIIGAFAAGLLLAKTHQKDLIEDRLKPVADVFIPIFFIMVGSAVDVSVFNPFIKENIAVIILALVLFIIAVIGKLVSGLGAYSLKANKLVIGIGMIPRGEVGLIFASMGLATGVLGSSDYSALTVMVMLTTFIAPPLLYRFFRD